MEYMEAGDTTNAITSFISDVGKHDGTKHIVKNNPSLVLFLSTEAKRGKEAFKSFLEGFAV